MTQNKALPFSLLFPLLLVFYELAVCLSNDLYLPALPEIGREFGVTDSLMQLTLTAWLLGSMLFQGIIGPLSDRYGRRRVLLTGGVLFIVSTIFCAIASDLTTLIIARFFQGCVVASMVIPGYATIHELCDQSKAIRILASMSTITVLAPAFGPLVGSFLLIVADWRFTFWLLALWAIVALIFLYKQMPETANKREPLVFKSILLSYCRILSNKDFLVNSLVVSLLFVGVILWIVSGPFLIITTFQYSAVDYGIFQALIFGCFVFGTQLVKYGMAKIAIEKFLKLGVSVLAVFSGLMIISVSLWPTALTGFVITMMICTTSCAFICAPLQRLAIEASDEPMGAKMAVYSTFIMGASTLSSVLVSLFYRESLPSLAYMIAIAFILACLLQWLFGEKVGGLRAAR